MESILQIIVTLIIVALFFYFAYILTRSVAGGHYLGVRGKNIRVMEKLPLSKDTSILLLKAVDKVLVVGVTPAGMTTLREVPPEEVPQEEEQQAAVSFSEAFRIAVRDSMPSNRLRDRVGRWLHVKKDDDRAKHL